MDLTHYLTEGIPPQKQNKQPGSEAAMDHVRSMKMIHMLEQGN